MNRLRILKYPWHTAHDYELAKLPHDFFYLLNTYRPWNRSLRPMPDNIKWVANHREVETDLAILHLDQWSFLEPAKRFLFLRCKRSYPGLKIVINHGCNMVDGCSSETMAKLVEGCFMVCNSLTAQQLWDIPRSRYIRHGMTPEEWPSTDYARHEVIVVQHYSDLHAEFRNNAGVARAERFLPIRWVGRDIKFNSFDKYRHYLQSSSIFFNPSYASPNPRARTEAMLTGLVVVTTNCHGEDEYIRNGVNGFCSNDFEELIDFLLYLKEHPKETRAMGQAGRRTAQEVFHIDRFVRQWQELLEEITRSGGLFPESDFTEPEPEVQAV
jgi:hypothetical protein